jgi:hypothetical protein
LITVTYVPEHVLPISPVYTGGIKGVVLSYLFLVKQIMTGCRMGTRFLRFYDVDWIEENEQRNNPLAPFDKGESIYRGRGGRPTNDIEFQSCHFRKEQRLHYGDIRNNTESIAKSFRGSYAISERTSLAMWRYSWPISLDQIKRPTFKKIDFYRKVRYLSCETINELMCKAR